MEWRVVTVWISRPVFRSYANADADSHAYTDTNADTNSNPDAHSSPATL